MLFNGFRPLFTALNPDDVNKLAYEIIQVLQGEGGTVASLLRRTASLTNTLADRDAVIGRVITNLNSVLATLAEPGRAAGPDASASCSSSSPGWPPTATRSARRWSTSAS